MYWLLILISTTIAFLIFAKLRTKKLIPFSIVETAAIVFPVFIFGYIGGRIDCVIQYNILQNHTVKNIQDFVHTFFFSGGFKNPLAHTFAIIALFAISRQYFDDKIRFLKALDKFIIFVAFCFIWGNIGCFFDGHSGCRGTPTNLFWGCTYSFSSNKSSIPLHPAQLYCALFYSIIFVTSLGLPKLKAGTLFTVFMCVGNLFLFLLDFIKERQIIFYNISYGQIIYFTNIFITIILALALSRKVLS
jgi:prolipoprotein diacylglyceryltransferase